MINEKVMTCEIGFPEITTMNRIPYMYSMDHVLSDYESSDLIAEDFFDKMFKLREEEFPDDYLEGVGVYYLNSEMYNELSERDKGKYELWVGAKGEYYIPSPVINIVVDDVSFPTSLGEKLTEVGMSYSDF